MEISLQVLAPSEDSGTNVQVYRLPQYILASLWLTFVQLLFTAVRK